MRFKVRTNTLTVNSFKKLWLLWSLLLCAIAALAMELSRPAAVPAPRANVSELPHNEQSQLTLQLESLQTEKREALTKIVSLEAETKQLKEQLAEHVRSGSNPSGKAAPIAVQSSAQKADSESELPFTKAVLALALKAGRLNAQLQRQTELDIPELQYLDEGDWLHFAKEADLDSDIGVRKALAEIRKQAKDRFATIAMQAFGDFMKASGGQPPLSLDQLRSHFPDSVDSSLLNRYQLVPAPVGTQLGSPVILSEKSPVDLEYDTEFKIGPTGWSSVGIGMGYLHKIK